MAPSKIVSMTPRPSASLVVVNERNEILLVHRNPKASSFGGMHVRPFSMSPEPTLPKLTEASLFSDDLVRSSREEIWTINKINL